MNVPHQAVVLAAGEGRRLRPVTDHTPKPLVPFLNVPQVEHALVALAAAGVRRVLLNAWHLAARMQAWAASDPVPGLDVEVHVEPELLGTGGGLGRLSRQLDPAPLLLLAADVLAPFDFAALTRHHAARGAEATMALTSDADPVVYGALHADGDGRLCDVLGRMQRPVGPARVNASAHLLEPQFLARFPQDRAACLVRDGYLPALAEGATLGAWLHEGPWAETGTPAAFLTAQRRALISELPIDPGLRDRGGRLRDGPALVHPSARVASDAALDGVVVGPAAVVPAGCRLRQCVLAEGVSLPPGAQLADAWIDTTARAHTLLAQESPTP